MTNWVVNRRRRVILDMHLCDWHPEILSEYDPKEIVEQVKRAEANVLVVWCKDHFGNAYYSTKVGRVHPLLKERDLVGEISKECEKKNIVVVGYYSVGVDGYIASKNPDWVVKDKNGVAKDSDIAPEDWGWPCINSPYKEYVLSQLQEIIQYRTLKGLWLDMMRYPRESYAACTCKYCQELFRKETGLEIPQEFLFGSEQWHKWHHFRHSTWKKFFQELRTFVRALRPEIQITHNFYGARLYLSWVGGGSLDLEKYDDYLTAESYAAHSGHLFSSIAPRFLRAAGKGKSFEVIILRFMQGWDWALAPLDQMIGEAMTILASGGAAAIDDHISPQGKVEDPVYDRIEKVFREVKRTEEYAEGLQSVKYAALVYSQSNKDIYANDSPERYMLGFYGAFKFLLEAHVPFDILMEEDISSERLKEYQVLVLPNNAIMHQDTARVIGQAFKEYNLGLIATYETSLYTRELNKRGNFALSCIGGKFLDDLSYSHTFIKFSGSEKSSALVKGLPVDLPIAVKNKALKVFAEKGIGKVVYPMTEYSSFRHITHPRFPPPGKESQFYAVVLNEQAGRAIYFPSKICASYAEHSVPELMKLFTNALNYCGGTPPLQVLAPKSVEAVFNEQLAKNRVIIHLINLPSEIGRHCVTKTREGKIDNFQVIDEVTPVNDIAVRVQKDWLKKFARVRSLEMGGLKVEEKNGYFEIQIPRVGIYEIVVIEK